MIKIKNTLFKVPQRYCFFLRYANKTVFLLQKGLLTASAAALAVTARVAAGTVARAVATAALMRMA